MMEWSIAIMAASLCTTIISAIGALTWWLGKQFSLVRHLVYETIGKTEDAILRKLEYHEQHDDVRFAALTNDLWDIRVRNAARDGLPPLSSRDKSTHA